MNENNDTLLKAGLESIHIQKDNGFIDTINSKLVNIIDAVKLELPRRDTTAMPSVKDYSRLVKGLKLTQIKNELDFISKLLTKRFGITVTVESTHKQLSNVVNSILPPINYRAVNQTLSNLDELFPNKVQSTLLWNVGVKGDTSLMYDTLSSLKTSLESNTFELDLKGAYIKGMSDGTIVINVNFITAIILDLTPSEISTLLIREIGVLFSHLEYMYSTTNNTHALLDNFMSEVFNKNRPMIDSLKYAIDNTEVDVAINTDTPTAILEGLEMFIFKTYRMDQRTGSIKLDYRTDADLFVSKFMLGDKLASLLVKIETSGMHELITSEDSSNNTFLTALTTLVKILVGVVSTILFLILGPLMLIVVLGVKAISLFFTVVLEFLTAMVSMIDNRPVRLNDSVTLMRRLRKIKLMLIKSLRSADVGDIGEVILVEQIDSLNKLMKSVSNTFGNMSSSKFNDAYFFNPADRIIDLMEDLQDNELHYLGKKLETLQTI